MGGHCERLDALIAPIPTPFATLVLASMLVALWTPFETVMHHGSQCPRCVATDTVRSSE